MSEDELRAVLGRRLDLARVRQSPIELVEYLLNEAADRKALDHDPKFLRRQALPAIATAEADTVRARTAAAKANAKVEAIAQQRRQANLKSVEARTAAAFDKEKLYRVARDEHGWPAIVVPGLSKLLSRRFTSVSVGHIGDLLRAERKRLISG